MVLQHPKLTVEDFYAFLDEQEVDRRYELIEGEIVEMPPSSNPNSRLALRLGSRLKVFF